MAGKYGIDQIKKVAALSCELVNVISKVANNQGVFSLFQVADELMAMSNLNADELKLEINELSEEDRSELIIFMKDKLALVNSQLEAKVEGGLDVVNEVFGLCIEAGQILVRAKAIIS